jgi:phosphatidylinositol alpha-1,6-mannosyltransferase
VTVLLISSEFPPGPGGIGTHAFQLALRGSRLGWAVTVVTPQDHAAPTDSIAFNSAQPFSVVGTGNGRARHTRALRRFLAVARTVTKLRPDLVIATGSASVRLAACVLGRRRPWIAVGHGAEFGREGSWTFAITKWAFARARLVATVSNYTAARMLESGVVPRRVAVVPNGADHTLFRPVGAETTRAFRERFGLGTGRLLLTVGSVTDRKGQDVVVQALSRLVREFDVRYVVVGVPLMVDRLRVLARRLGVGDRLHVLGAVDPSTLVAAYNACDVFVMVSRHVPDGDFEGFGIAVVEAALCGKPAVVTAGSGLVEAVAPGRTAFVVPEGDPDTTSDALARLLSDAGLREEMGRRARHRALSDQTWDHSVARYDRLLREVLCADGRATVKSRSVTGS